MIDPKSSADAQRYQALRAGEDAGWWSFEAVADGLYLVVLPGGVRRELRPAAVLPWVQGQADARGAGNIATTGEGPL